MTIKRLLLVLVLLVACITLEFTRLLIKPFPPTQFESSEGLFKYGSIGAEAGGYPYQIWRELPTIFHDRVPKGWREFGFIEEAGSEVPIGISVRRIGVERVGFNCGTCHTSFVRTPSGERLLLGAPAAQLDLQAYLRFIAEASVDPSLTPEAVFASAKANGRPIGWVDKFIIKKYVFPRLTSQVALAGENLFWMIRRPEHGPGRTDAGNFWRARWGLNPELDDRIGTVDFPSVWNQSARLNGGFHWDGNNTSLQERNYSAALAGGSSDWLFSVPSQKRIPQRPLFEMMQSEI